MGSRWVRLFARGGRAGGGQDWNELAPTQAASGTGALRASSSRKQQRKRHHKMCTRMHSMHSSSQQVAGSICCSTIARPAEPAAPPSSAAHLLPAAAGQTQVPAYRCSCWLQCACSGCCYALLRGASVAGEVRPGAAAKSTWQLQRASWPQSVQRAGDGPKDITSAFWALALCRADR